MSKNPSRVGKIVSDLDAHGRFWYILAIVECRKVLLRQTRLRFRSFRFYIVDDVSEDHF